MTSHDPVRVFIGSGEASLLERKTLIYSLRKHSKRELDIYVFNGSHNSIERNNEPPVLAPMSLRVKYRNHTEFSIYRFFIPEICNYKGKAIFLDSDIVNLRDIGELFDTPMNGNDILAVGGNYKGANRWALSVALFDCATCRFDVEKIFDEIDASLYTYTDFSSLTPLFLQHYSHKVGKLDPTWNMFDRVTGKTKQVHYTNLDMQPWKYANHPYGDLWHRYFKEAIVAGAISKDDIDKTLSRAYVRRDILKGNFTMMGLGRLEGYVRYTTPNIKSMVKRVLGR